MTRAKRLDKLEARAHTPRGGEVWLETLAGDWERLGGAALMLTPAELELHRKTPGLVVLDFGLKR